MKVHFICLGNVFRSRIAEAYLNSLEFAGIEVSSSGVLAKRDYDINGGIFIGVNELLTKHGIIQFAKNSYGYQTTQELIDKSDLVICMDPIVREECSIFRMPQDTLVWGVEDMDEETHSSVTKNGHHDLLEERYLDITRHIDELVEVIA